MKRIKALKGTKMEDLTGIKFKNLTVVRLDYEKHRDDKIKLKTGEIKKLIPIWICKCECGEEFYLNVYALTKGKAVFCDCEYSQRMRESTLDAWDSFEYWCNRNDRLDLLLLWDYTLNDKIPRVVSKSSNKKYWFKCPKGIHSSELRYITTMTRNTNYIFKCKKCNSIGQYLLDTYGKKGIGLYWSKKNTLSPFEVSFKTDCVFVFMKCQNKDYHGDYKTTPCDFVMTNSRCPYCYNRKIHEFDSLGSLSPEVVEIWSDKNTKSPFEIAPKARDKFWFKCENGKHIDYEKAIYSGSARGFRCPNCNFPVSNGEIEVEDVLKKYNIRCDIQKKFDGLLGTGGGNLSYDFYLLDINVLIEYDGEFHYFPIKGEEELIKQQKHDELKNNYAKNNNIKLIRIPYWDFDNIEEILIRELKL